jgi:DedD protein
MDRQLAERMVGAACLLAVLVLVVPAILDGNPDSGATITHPSVEESVGLRTRTIRLDRAQRDPSVPGVGQVPAGPEPSTQPQPQPQPQPQLQPPPESPSESEPSPESAPPSASSGVPAPTPVSAATPVRSLAQEVPVASGNWFVQVGSFSKRENADRLAGELQRKGFTTSVLGGGGSSGALFRVRAGPEVDRTAAEALAGRLATAGFPGGRIGRQ